MTRYPFLLSVLDRWAKSYFLITSKSTIMLFLKVLPPSVKSFLMLVLIVSIVSCQKENMEDLTDEAVRSDVPKNIEDFPAEITIDNWEVFVHAPQEVIDFHQQREWSKQISATPKDKEAANRSASILGFVRGYQGSSWNPLPDVSIFLSGPGCNSSTTSNTSSPFNYSLNINCSGTICMDPNAATAINGVSTLDLVLTQRHILSQYPDFTEARQYLAADVNRNGQISSTDLIQMRNLILGNTPGWTNSRTIVYVKETDLITVQNQIDILGYVIPSTLESVGETFQCQPQSKSNRWAIKTGDVNGTFSF